MSSQIDKKQRFEKGPLKDILKSLEKRGERAGNLEKSTVKDEPRSIPSDPRHYYSR